MRRRIDFEALDALHPAPARESESQRLGRAVLSQAILDWRRQGRPGGTDTPLNFFLFSPTCALFTFWCTATGLDPGAVRQALDAERPAGRQETRDQGDGGRSGERGPGAAS